MKLYQRLGLAALLSAVGWFSARSLNNWAYQSYDTLSKDSRAPIYLQMRKSLAHLEEAKERISDDERGRHSHTRMVRPIDLFYAIESIDSAEQSLGNYGSIDDHLREIREGLKQRHNGQSYRSYELKLEQHSIDSICGEIQNDKLYRSFDSDIAVNNVKEIVSWGLYTASVMTALFAITGEVLRKRMRKEQS